MLFKIFLIFAIAMDYNVNYIPPAIEWEFNEALSEIEALRKENERLAAENKELQRRVTVLEQFVEVLIKKLNGRKLTPTTICFGALFFVIKMYLFSDEKTSILPAAIISSCLKIMLLNCYHSTDFEVHRNWLAITFSLPISKWYFEDTSEWTLDYPPFFAWFEYVLSQFAYYFDAKMLIVKNLNYASQMTVLFQRMSVICGDFLLMYAVREYCTRIVPDENKDKPSLINKRFFVFWSIILNAGLLLVDHIHFQYNGFLFGIFILSVVKMLEGKELLSGFWFAVLLNFKHLFAYIAPVYFVFLLRSFCFKRNIKLTGIFALLGVNVTDLIIGNLIKLGIMVITIFSLSLGPFVYMGQFGQVLSRLFPVKRGLCHAYWAANFWAVYATFDKALLVTGSKLKFIDSSTVGGSMTGGLVGIQKFGVLWDIPPVMTFICALACMLPALMKLWHRPFLKNLFLPCLVLCAYASFLFGYHVHEKAVLMMVIPMSFLAVQSSMYARIFTILSIAGHFALFPLLPKEAETPIKVIIFLMFTIASIGSLKIIHRSSALSSLGIPFVTWYEAIYIHGFLWLFLYTSIGHWLIGLHTRLPFLPLMMTSFYCSIGILWSWILLYRYYMYLDEPKKEN